MGTTAPFSVRFWGVRGSIACSGPRTVRYGGNTSSLEVRCGDELLLFDAGTGMRYLGKTLEGARLEGDLFFTHTHFDHICGLPFFRPLFEPQNHFRLWAGHLRGAMTLKRVLAEFMMSPLFPVPPEVFRASLEYCDFNAGDTLNPMDGIIMKTAPLNHPNGATGYRVEWQGKSICYVTDCEHNGKGPDPVVVDLIRDSDIFIYDTSYTDEEYPTYSGWGHSTWQEGVRLANAAKVKTLVLFHHDPSHTDAVMDQISADAVAIRPGTVTAREGMVLKA
jgi:phosphoribosyl 1,2-cyclic phosphodiesterase